MPNIVKNITRDEIKEVLHALVERLSEDELLQVVRFIVELWKAS